MMVKLVLCSLLVAVFTGGQTTGLVLCKGRRTVVGTAEPYTHTSWGSWGRQTMCPGGYYAYGFQLKVEPEQGSGDDTAANGVRLFCSCPSMLAEKRPCPQPDPRRRGGPYLSIESRTERFGRWTAPRSCPCNSFIKGLEVRSEPNQKTGDDTAVNNVHMVCQNSSTHKLLGSGTRWGNWHSAACPGNSLACGIQTKVEKAGQFDDTALNKVKLICCSPPAQPYITGNCGGENFPDPRRWVPAYHFHMSHQCFPDVAHSNQNRKCARRFNPNAPVYWHGEKCGASGYKLQYWLWYGWQKGCDAFGLIGKHDNDWEYVNVNFLRCGTKYCVDSVTFGQHKGWYTRMFAYDNENSRPQVYVGHIAHGNFHDSNKPNSRPSGGHCPYFADNRGSRHVWTPTNLKPLADFNGSTDPVEKWATELHRRKILCSIAHCRGTGLEISGCKANNFRMGQY